MLLLLDTKELLFLEPDLELALDPGLLDLATNCSSDALDCFSSSSKSDTLDLDIPSSFSESSALISICLVKAS